MEQKAKTVKIKAVEPKIERLEALGGVAGWSVMV